MSTCFRRPFTPSVLLLFAVAVLAASWLPASAQTSRPRTPTAASPYQASEQRWLERMPEDERAALDAHVGFAPPVFPASLTWLNGTPQPWESYRGKVVVIQSWTNKTSAGRKVPTIAERLRERFAEHDVQLLLLHTPEGADGLPRFLSRRTLAFPVLVDESGAFCDALGVYKRPTNILIDRQGAIRYAGLKTQGLTMAVDRLVAESFDPSQRPTARPPVVEAPAAAYPPSLGSIRNANDVRGKRAPDFYVEDWVNGRPDATGKVVVIDFWATWCGPCVATIPHMNMLADRFRGDAAFIGISDESERSFDKGLDKRNLKERDFRYALGLDRSGRMKRAVDIRAIPHCLVMSRDWVVRWQGHPAALTSDILRQIIDADRATGAGGPASSGRRRWTAE